VLSVLLWLMASDYPFVLQTIQRGNQKPPIKEGQTTQK
jgi:hypothetical protein